MLLFRCTDNSVQFWEDEKHWDVSFPEKLARTPTAAYLSWDHRYVAFGNDRGIEAGSPPGTLQPTGLHGIWVYDLQKHTLTAVPHRVQPSDVFWEASFDRNGALYYSDGNAFWRWNIGDQNPERLFKFQRVKGAPMGMAVNANGDHIAYYKFKSDERRFHLYDIRTDNDQDLKFSIYHFGWLDDTHIAWTRSGGLKLLDIESGKSTLLLKNYQSIMKKCNKADAELLSPFTKFESIDVFEDLDVLGFCENRIMFMLRLFSPKSASSRIANFLNKKPQGTKHSGIWSVALTGKDVRFHFPVPSNYKNSFYTGWDHSSNCLRWIDKEQVLQLWDGQKQKFFPAGWMPVFMPEDCWG